MPEATPQTEPVAEPAVAVAVALLLQVPPVVASVSVMHEPGQTALPPLIAAGVGFTVTTAVM